MLGPFPDMEKMKKASAKEQPVSGEIELGDRPANLEFEIGGERIGVDPTEAAVEKAASTAERAALKRELQETETDLERVSIQIRQLETDMKASPTDEERKRMEKKMNEAAAAAEKAGQDAEMVGRLVAATKLTFLEGREGMSDRLKGLKQRAVDLAEQKSLLEEKLDGAEHSA